MRHEQRPDGDEVNTSPEYGTDARGEDLAHAGEAPGEDYTVVDDEAEELTNASDEVDSTPDRGDPEDMVVDDPQQLSEAEAVARRARSSRPQRRDGPKSSAGSDSPRRGAARRSVPARTPRTGPRSRGLRGGLAPPPRGPMPRSAR